MPQIAKLTGYPELRRFLTHSLSHLPQYNQKVFRAFLKWSTLDEPKARVALLPFFGPQLIVRPHQIPGYARYEGLDFIVIREDFANQYEAAVMVQVQVQSVNQLMESKILHEMVHWGYTTRYGRLDPRSPERGWEFEEEAYGSHLTATSLGLRDFISISGTL